MRRRDVVIGGAALAMMGTAHAKGDARIAVPDAGTILAPKGYAADDRWQKGQHRGGLVLFRKLRSVLGGYLECDGLINVCSRKFYADLDAFCDVMTDSGTTRWEHGNLKPGWTSFDSEKFPITYGAGPLGRERVQELHLTSAGFLGSRKEQGWRVGFETPQVWVQCWVLQREGGVKQARKLAADVVASYQA